MNSQKYGNSLVYNKTNSLNYRKYNFQVSQNRAYARVRLLSLPKKGSMNNSTKSKKSSVEKINNKKKS